MLAQTALKYDVEVNKNGLVELAVPFPAGAHVTVFILEAGEICRFAFCFSKQPVILG